jgi:adenosylcobinamide-GDP ribazoletransferase
MMERLRGAGRTVVMAFSLFSRIPMPQIRWDKANMRYLMCGFLLVGAAVGLAQCAWMALAGWLGLSALLRGAGYVLVAAALTGGIHLDGFCDVADALSSHAEPARKIEIMKDPHCGAFALIALVCCILAWTALASELALGADWHMWLALGLVPVAGRCTSGLATLALPSASKKGMQETFREAAADRRPLVALGASSACVLGLSIWANPAFGAGAALVCGACFGLARRRARREFGGFNGDQAGSLLVCCELALLALLVVVQKAGLL